ncbi:hypothetical protein [Spartinivicinus poritis]|uniref:Uncharacterized protein n=1 Tax=Spartinivicinus poritis TaxID=2994640 RepID=A0ABT5UFX4_9GAMM|nr:hypothetical protein [Spartinivicinus sp. A2-2]MDE1465277.1 hypothetical protein [Spartinivicinus sp. A2-2]
MLKQKQLIGRQQLAVTHLMIINGKGTHFYRVVRNKPSNDQG